MEHPQKHLYPFILVGSKVHDGCPMWIYHFSIIIFMVNAYINLLCTSGTLKIFQTELFSGSFLSDIEM